LKEEKPSEIESACAADCGVPSFDDSERIDVNAELIDVSWLLWRTSPEASPPNVSTNITASPMRKFAEALSAKPCKEQGFE